MGGGGGGGSGPTVQQRQLETQQALTTANLNLEENSQRKSILNAMMGTRVFKGSALSRAVRGNTPGTGGVAAAPAPSASQTTNSQATPVSPTFTSLIDLGSGATPAGGAGASGGAVPAAVGGRAGGGSNSASNASRR